MCYDSNNGSVIIYIYIIVMCINTPVITLLLPVITVIMDNITCYDSNNGPIITVIIDPL